MSQSKHTPGPWEVTEDLGMDEAWCNWHRVGPVELMGGKANADSRLIAAAPDLLEALKALELQALQSNVNSAANEWGREALGLARAAIAKAEGQP